MYSCRAVVTMPLLVFRCEGVLVGDSHSEEEWVTGARCKGEAQGKGEQDWW